MTSTVPSRTAARPSRPRARMATSMPGSGRPIEPGRMSAPARLAIMIPPVSVCHQLSCTGSPSTSWPQTTASGFSGSPTLATKRKLDRSYSRASSGPAFISMRRAVGAVYQTVTRWSWRIWYQRSASNSASSTTHVTPWVSGVMMPYDVPVTQPGSAVHQYTSSGCRSSAVVPVAKWATTASWTCTAPFGVPVVPLVKCSSAMSSGSVGGISNSSDAPARRSSKPTAPGDGRRRRRRRPARTCSSCGRRSRMGATLRRYNAGCRDEHPAVAPFEPLVDRFGPERREQRAEHAGVLERAEGGEVQLGCSSEQGEHPVALCHPELAHGVGEAVRARRRAGRTSPR